MGKSVSMEEESPTPVEAPLAPEGLLSTEDLDTEVAELSVLNQAQLSLADVSNMTLQALTSMAEKAVEMKEVGVAGAGQLLDDISLRMRAMVTAAQEATGFMASTEVTEDTTQIASPRPAPVPVETAPEPEAKALSVKETRVQAEDAANVKAAEKAAFEDRQLERMQEKMKKAEERDGSLSPKSRSSAAEEKKAFEARNLERAQAKLEGQSPKNSPKHKLPS